MRSMVEGPVGRTKHRFPPDTDIIAFLRALQPGRRAEAVATLGAEEREALDRSWDAWAHAGQRAPAKCPDGSDWRTWVIMAGRGFGKTLAGAHWVREAAAAEPRLRAALVAATLDEARRVMVEGDTGLLEVAGDLVAEWSPSRRLLQFRNGARATLFSGASPDQLRGPQHHVAWCDELAKWEKAQETWDMLQLGLRLGPMPRALVTTTPRSGPVLARIMASPGCVTTRGSTYDNPHLPEAFVDAVTTLYAGTRLGRQELGGELLTDTPGALWTVELLERCRLSLPLPLAGEGAAGLEAPSTWKGRWNARGGRGEGTMCELGAISNSDLAEPVEALFSSPSVQEKQERPSTSSGKPVTGTIFTRIVIGVDPPSGDGTCGIIACARDEAGIAHVLADHSVTARTPEGWATAVATAAAIHSHPLALSLSKSCSSSSLLPSEVEGRLPDPLPVLIVAETNQGGKMVKAILHTADPNLAVKPVTASLAKADRAAPVAHLFKAGKVLLHGRFPELEAQLLGLIAGRPYQGPGDSPDRADAMVWALTELMLSARGQPSVRAL